MNIISIMNIALGHVLYIDLYPEPVMNSSYMHNMSLYLMHVKGSIIYVRFEPHETNVACQATSCISKFKKIINIQSWTDTILTTYKPHFSLICSISGCRIADWPPRYNILCALRSLNLSMCPPPPAPQSTCCTGLI